MRYLLVALLLITSLAYGEELKTIERSRSHTFKNISSLSGLYPARTTVPQQLELYEGTAGGNNRFILAVDTAISADIVLTVKSDGLYKGATKLLSW